jgi:hypothetical protein
MDGFDLWEVIGESERRHFATPSQGAWGNTLIKADAV